MEESQNPPMKLPTELPSNLHSEMPTELPEVYNDLSTPIIPVITINETTEVNVMQGHHFIAEEVANVRVEIQDVDSDE